MNFNDLHTMFSKLEENQSYKNEEMKFTKTVLVQNQPLQYEMLWGEGQSLTSFRKVFCVSSSHRISSFMTMTSPVALWVTCSTTNQQIINCLHQLLRI